MSSRTLLVLALGVGLLVGGPASAEPAAVGHVVALAGHAFAVQPDGRTRALGCFDAVRPGEIVYTASGSRVGVLTSEVYAQLDAQANLAFDHGPEDAPSLRLIDGGIRLVDTRAGEDQRYQLETPEGRARGLGSDTAVVVSRSPMRERTRLCEAARAVEISRFRPSDAIVSAHPGACTVVTSEGRLYAEEPTDAQPGLLGTEQCGVDTLSDLASRFDPRDVAAPPLPDGAFPPIAPSEVLGRDPCDDPGSGCAGGAFDNGFQFVDPDPDPGCGGGGFGCGGQ